MRKYSKALYKDILPTETNMDTGFKEIGFIELATDKHRLEYYRRVANYNRLQGVNIQELSPKEVQEKFPIMETNDVLAGFYVPDDGRVNPYDATMALARGAKMYGAQIYEHTPVKGITKSRTTNSNSTTSAIPKVTGVILESGERIIECNVVVNCAGMWARQFGEKCGVNVPNQAAEHYYLITDVMESVDPNWPVVEDSSKCVYIRPGMCIVCIVTSMHK
jgi:4-methylaminobutanoate oxidase (formaldehyde-forming)